jgi:hypothetical protein
VLRSPPGRFALVGLAPLALLAAPLGPVDVAHGATRPSAEEQAVQVIVDASVEPLEDPGEPGFETWGWRTDFGISAVPFDEIVPGGPPKDGIPAIHRPRFDAMAQARGWLTGTAPVLALEIDGEARAYPLAILVWHEIVNDRVAEVPVVVTFCPLCNTALVFERTVDGVEHVLGTTGDLRYSDLVMYDHATESWWQQATGHAMVGELTGTRLVFLPAQLISLDQFAATWPDGLVLSRDTGHPRRYEDSPYAGFDTAERRPYLVRGEPIGGIGPKERVVAVGEGADAMAFPHAALRDTGTAQATVDGRPLVVFWEPRSDSDKGEGEGDVLRPGSTGVFRPVVDGRRLTFVRNGGPGTPITDTQTGSTWSVTGRAVDGPLAGGVQEPVVHGDHFWFAWVAFSPDTRVWSAPPAG